ncbi:MAG: hypothetical protein EZS28_033295, partial [Streblomastix strix]
YVSQDTFNVNGVEYYVQSANSGDSNSCSFSAPCLTLGTITFQNNVNTAETFIVYIVDRTSINQQLYITQTSSPRTFRNYPDSSETYRDIRAANSGQFYVAGQVLFNYINFVVERGTAQVSVIQVQSSSSAVVDITNCKVSMTIGADLISRSLVLQYGGYLNIDNLNASYIVTTQAIIQCSSTVISINITNSHFEDITRTQSDSQNEGGIVSVSLSGSGYYLTGSQFIQCKSTEVNSKGGALYLSLQKYAHVNLKNLEFDQCEAYRGGGIYVDSQSDYQLTLSTTDSNQFLFTECIANLQGGGIYANIQYNCKLTLSGNCLFTSCSANNGNGGGIYSYNDGGNVIINSQCKFYQCISYGNGGGIYHRIAFFQSVCKFTINDAIFQECEAKYSSSVPGKSGYGGGIFIGAYSNFAPSAGDILDLHGMKIDGNKADNYGQSLYVILNNLESWCMLGTKGYYVKGNYSDATSNENELMGVPFNQSTFDFFTESQMQSGYKNLESYWNPDGSGTEPGDDEDSDIVYVNKFYVQASGDNSNQCTSSSQCKTLETQAITIKINNAETFIVYIVDETSLSQQITISEYSSPRTFRNYPTTSTTFGTIQITPAGSFNISGSARFRYINFIIESNSNTYSDAFLEQSSHSDLTILNCKVSQSSTNALMHRSFLVINYGTAYINKLTIKDIQTDTEVFMLQGSSVVTIENSTFEKITMKTAQGFSDYHGIIYARFSQPTSSFNLIDTLFLYCNPYYIDSLTSGLYINLESAVQLVIDEVTFTDCKGYSGGGLYANLLSDSSLTLSDCNFSRCSSYENGGGVYALLNSNSQLTLSGFSIHNQ